MIDIEAVGKKMEFTLFDKGLSTIERISQADYLLKSVGIPNSQEVGTRLVKIAQTPWFLIQNIEPGFVIAQTQEAIRRLTFAGDSADANIEVITDWVTAEKRATSAKEFEHEVHFDQKTPLFFRAPRVVMDVDRGGRRVVTFLTKGTFNVWEVVQDLIGSSSEFKEISDILEHLSAISLGVRGRLRLGGARVLDNFHYANFKPSWEREYEEDTDEDGVYCGGKPGIKLYDKLLQSQSFGHIAGRVYNQPRDTAFLYVGEGLVKPQLEKLGMPDTTESLIELYQKGCWPIGYSRDAQASLAYTVLTPPVSAYLKRELRRETGAHRRRSNHAIC